MAINLFMLDYFQGNIIPVGFKNFWQLGIEMNCKNYFKNSIEIELKSET